MVFFLAAVVVNSYVVVAQDSVGNIFTGDAKVEIVKKYDDPEPLPRPGKIVIQDFSPIGQIVTDDSLAERLHQHHLLKHNQSSNSYSGALMRKVQDSFSKTLINELAKDDISTQRASDAEPVSIAPVFVVEGEFLAIDQGNMSKRIMLGFGRGASDIKTHVVVFSFYKGQRRVVLEFNLNSESGKKPGAITTMGVGSIAVNAVAGDAGDRRATVEFDASRTAKLVSIQIKNFMKTQHWITRPKQE